MSNCELRLVFDQPDFIYHFGDPVSGVVEVRTHSVCHSCSLFLDWQWHTHGAGNPDSGEYNWLILFEGEWGPEEVHHYPFNFTVPSGPETYHGYYLNVDWYVRAKAKIARDTDSDVEQEILIVHPESLLEGDSWPDMQRDDMHQNTNLGSTYKPPVAERIDDEVCPAVNMLVGGIPSLALGLSSLLGFTRTFGSWIPPEARDFAFLILIGLGLLFLAPLKSKYGWFVAITIFVGFILVGFGIMGNLLGAVGAVFGGAVLSLLGLYLTYCGAHYMRIGRVRIQIYPTGVRRGDSIKCQVQIAEVRASALERASATLFAQELVIAGYLTRPEKNTLVVYENPWPLVAASPESLGAVVTFEGLCNVPTDAPITFSSRFNNLVCGMTIRLSVAHGPNWARSYQVAVYP